MRREEVKKGKRITSLSALKNLALTHHSVIVPDHGGFSSPKPAAVVINLQGWLLQQLFERGMYEYKSKHAKRPGITQGFREKKGGDA